MVLYGTAHRVGDGITTDDIIAPEQRGAGDPAWLAAHCLAVVDPAIAEQAREGDVLLAGHDFGGGDEPDIAALALLAAGFAAVVCASADAAFADAAAAYGLPVLVCPAALAIAAGGVARIDLASGKITDRASGATFQALPCPAELLDAVRRSQLLSRMRRVVEEEGFDG
ncbi:MAG: 3-isopropylmalate dehydratase small subunit [Kouleothrix sp.]|nr:3-isopropylmalate dehydratase small subunit [Kouleothrix sp.]